MIRRFILAPMRVLGTALVLISLGVFKAAQILITMGAKK